jgi:cbb3-type cytochrome oxidase subunit 3
MTGVILLIFIGALVAYFFTRGRRKMGLSVNGKHWKTIILAVVLIGVVMYAASYPPH